MAKKPSPKSENKAKPKKELSVQIWVALIGLAGTALGIIVTLIIALIENGLLFRAIPAQTEIPVVTATLNSENNLPIDMDPATGCPAGMVPVEAGDFRMGPDPQVRQEETRERTIYLDKFCIHEKEVSIGEYEAYLASRNLTPPPELQVLRPDFPAVYITWEDAEDYCVDHNYRLPTEAQWEKAARGTDGRLFPWGNDPWQPDFANCCQAPPQLQPVHQNVKGKSPYGVLNMAGNAAEWVTDWYIRDWYLMDELRNPTGPRFNTDLTKVVRGGDYFSSESLVRVTVRNGAYNQKQPIEDLRAIGFRCVYHPSPN